MFNGPRQLGLAHIKDLCLTTNSGPIWQFLTWQMNQDHDQSVINIKQKSLIFLLPLRTFHYPTTQTHNLHLHLLLSNQTLNKPSRIQFLHLHAFLLSMAVEASHITLYLPPNREMMYQDQLPKYGSGETDSFTSALPISRKRSRDGDSSSFFVPNVNRNGYTFLGVDISSQIYQQQSEIDRLIACHTEKVRSEIKEMRNQNARRLIASVHETIMKRLKTKEDEIVKIGQMNWSLEEKLKSLSTENQSLKELVQTNEATANALRNKLRQVLAQVQLQQQQQQQHHYLDLADNNNNTNTGKATVMVDDAQSYCGSNYEEDHRQLVEGRERKLNNENEECNSNSVGGRRCRKCGIEESCVLLLPCRHLCVCRLCVSSISLCPICNSIKSAGVHVNMSSS